SGAAVKWTALLGVAAVAARWCVRSASGRHMVWLLAVLGLLVLPVAERWAPAWRVPGVAGWRGEGEGRVGEAELGRAGVGGAGAPGGGGGGGGGGKGGGGGGRGRRGFGGAVAPVVDAWADLVAAREGRAERAGDGRSGALRGGVTILGRAWPWVWALV